MAKTSKKQIEVDETKVIEQLQKNCMENLDLFAKNCGFSRQKVWRIIKKLEGEKTIWGYTVIYDQERYNMKHFTMMIKRTTVPLQQNMIQEILTTHLDDILPDFLIKIENIEYVHGFYDGIFTFFAPDLIVAKRFCDRFKERFYQYIASADLLEGIFFVRNQTLQNPDIKKIVHYL